MVVVVIAMTDKGFNQYTEARSLLLMCLDGTEKEYIC